MNRMPFPRILAVAALGMQAAAPQFAADIVHLTLTDAVHTAISQNRALRIARLKVAEKGRRKAEEHAAYFPESRMSPICCALQIWNLSIYRREVLGK